MHPTKDRVRASRQLSMWNLLEGGVAGEGMELCAFFPLLYHPVHVIIRILCNILYDNMGEYNGQLC